MLSTTTSREYTRTQRIHHTNWGGGGGSTLGFAKTRQTLARPETDPAPTVLSISKLGMLARILFCSQCSREVAQVRQLTRSCGRATCSSQRIRSSWIFVDVATSTEPKTNKQQGGRWGVMFQTTIGTTTLAHLFHRLREESQGAPRGWVTLL